MNAAANPTPKRKDNLWIALIIGAFVAFGLAYSVVNPLHEATDELRHYRFVRYIVANRSLPVQGQEPCRSQSHHPPLIYALGALATAGIDTGRDVCHAPAANPFWAYRLWEVGNDNKNQFIHGSDEAFPWQGEALAAHVVRAINVLMGAAVVYCTWLTGRWIWPNRPKIPLLGAAIVAFNPMFVYMSSAINNDVVAALGSALVMVVAVKMMFSAEGITRRSAIWLGVAFGVALMSKFNNVALIGIIQCALLWVALFRRQWRQFFVANGVMLLVAALIAGWWFVRNQLLYGEPTGFRILTELWGVRDPSESWGLAISELPYAWSTLWGRFGFGQIPLPQPVYTGLLWFVGLGIVAAVIRFIIAIDIALRALADGAERSRFEQSRVGAILLLFGFVILFFAVLFNYMLVSPAGPMGRFFFPGLPALALLVAFGWHAVEALLGKLRLPTVQLLTPLLGCGMVLLTTIALVRYLQPAYAQPPSWTDSAEIPNPIDASIGGLGRIAGATVSTRAVAPGQAVDVTLYWEVTEKPIGDFYWFVHLHDEIGFVTQRDTHPGTGTLPTSQWQVGDKFADTVTLHIPDVAVEVDSAEITLGFYAPDGSYRLPIYENGVGIGDTLSLGNIAISGSAPIAAHNFSDIMLLTNYQYQSRTVQPGKPLDLTLTWLPLQDNVADYDLIMRVLDHNGKDWAWVKSRLNQKSWVQNELVSYTHQLYLADDTPEGVYSADLILINRETGDQQNLIHPDGHWIDNHLPLAKLRVQPASP